MPAPAKTLTVATAAALVAVCTYTVALGSNGWLWFAWAVLGLSTLGVVLFRGR